MSHSPGFLTQSIPALTGLMAALVLGTGCAQSGAKKIDVPAKVTIAKACTFCHQAQPGNLRGTFDNVAFKANSIQLKMDDTIEIVKFDKAGLKVMNGDKTETSEFLKQVKKGHEVRVAYTEKDGKKVASEFSIKQPLKLSPEMLISTAEVEKLVAMGPEKGKYTLIDSRPVLRVQDGAIPTAINIPFPTFDKMTDRLPADKDRLIIFYCAGVTCQMSPMSAKKAQALGYKNMKVYHEGMPAWSKVRWSVLSPQFLKEAWIDKDIPHVLIDIRPAKAAAKGFIKGAISLSPKQLKAALATFPSKDMKPPFMVYDDKGGKEAQKFAQALIDAGYSGARVITGGFEGWTKAGFPVESGTLATAVKYVPKLRPGEIAFEEFRKIATEKPADSLILDARNADEAATGMIPGALNIPADQILDRLSDVPKNKQIVTHCSTGIRAEMAFHTLKEQGYRVKFLNKPIEISKDGAVKLQ